MSAITTSTTQKVAIITGAARRVGAAIAKRLHQDGANVLIHYGHSADEAQELADSLNQLRPSSAACHQADLRANNWSEALVNKAIEQWGRVDIIVNNASAFYPTPLGNIKETTIDALFATNFSAPLQLTQTAIPQLQKNQGVVINLIDVHAYRPYPQHSVYCATKAALLSLTRSLALELAPLIRVNGIAPGSILWPEGEADISQERKDEILAGIPLQRNGSVDDIANCVAFLCSANAGYISGQIIAVDGGRSL